MEHDGYFVAWTCFYLRHCWYNATGGNAGNATGGNAGGGIVTVRNVTVVFFAWAQYIH